MEEGEALAPDDDSLFDNAVDADGQDFDGDDLFGGEESLVFDRLVASERVAELVCSLDALFESRSGETRAGSHGGHEPVGNNARIHRKR